MSVRKVWEALQYPERVNTPTPYSGEGLRVHDHHSSVEAVVRAWVEAGVDRRWHRDKQRQVREAMPVLARALDRLAKESRDG